MKNFEETKTSTKLFWTGGILVAISYVILMTLVIMDASTPVLYVPGFVGGIMSVSAVLGVILVLLGFKRQKNGD